MATCEWRGEPSKSNRATEVIDLIAAEQTQRPPTQRPPSKKRTMHERRLHQGFQPSSSGERISSEPAQFSDGEPDSPRATQPATPASWEVKGFDFSGSILADAAQPACSLCGEQFEISWDPARKELIVRNAVLLRHAILHETCVASRRGCAVDTARGGLP